MARDSLGFMPLLCFVSASRWILSDSRLLMGVLHLCSHCFRRKSIIASCRFDTQSLVSLVLCLFDGTGVEP
ncbi:BnaC02g00290D [Brassica napus]|uniref:BnaC02g00290D protein n=1 Tax=Brassica napus TaxID=3708 RepID=A0A078HR10_BRANA|nr:BnaC02g00290D [Brassica napus]